MNVFVLFMLTVWRYSCLLMTPTIEVTMPKELEKELQTYQERLPSLLAQEGKFVVICGTDVVGVFGTYEDALKAGYGKCGVSPFLVKKIQSVEQFQYFSRDLDVPCPT